MDLSAQMDELFRLAAAGDADGVAAMCADGETFALAATAADASTPGAYRGAG